MSNTNFTVLFARVKPLEFTIHGSIAVQKYLLAAAMERFHETFPALEFCMLNLGSTRIGFGILDKTTGKVTPLKTDNMYLFGYFSGILASLPSSHRRSEFNKLMSSALLHGMPTIRDFYVEKYDAFESQYISCIYTLSVEAISRIMVEGNIVNSSDCCKA